MLIRLRKKFKEREDNVYGKRGKSIKKILARERRQGYVSVKVEGVLNVLFAFAKASFLVIL